MDHNQAADRHLSRMNVMAADHEHDRRPEDDYRRTTTENIDCLLPRPRILPFIVVARRRIRLASCGLARGSS